MKEYWQNLSDFEKVKFIVLGIVSLLILIFAVQNWQSTHIFVLTGDFFIPTTLLIVFSMFGGYAFSRVLSIRKSRKYKAEIRVLQEQLKKLKAEQHSDV